MDEANDIFETRVKLFDHIYLHKTVVAARIL